MAITVKHSKVSLIPDSGDDSLIEPSDWNADHELTGTIPVANGGTGADTLTGYVVGNGTSAMTASATIPNTDVTGLGTMSTQDASNVAITGGTMSGVAVSGYIPTSEKAQPLGVATLDAGGKVPTSQIPMQGDLNYQGTWNASTNTPTLTSSTGTKGYYYVVDVAGTTNLNGITDWQIGDWAIYNGTVWQKVDNTDAVTSVNGQTGTVVLTTTNIAEGTNQYFTTARARSSVSAGTGISYNSTTGVITNSSPSLGGDVVGPASATDNALARYDSTTGKLLQNSLVIVDDTGSVTGVNALTAESLTVNNNATIGSSNTDTLEVISRITSDLDPNSNNAKDIGSSGRNWRDGFFGRTLHTVNLELTGTTSFDGSQGTSGQVLTSAGTGNTPTWTTPTTGTVTSVAASGGTGISISGGPITSSGTITITNTAPDQTVVLTSGTGISTSGTYPNFTITNSAPDQVVSLTGSGATSISGTYPNFTISSTNTTYSPATSTVAGLIELGSDTVQTVASNAVSATASRSYALQVNAAGQAVVNVPWTDTNSGGTVTSVATGTGLTGGPITGSGTISLANTAVSAGSYTLANITVDAQGRITAASNGSAGGTGTVTSVSATTPTGLTVTGSPITTSGTLAFSFTAGYSIPTTASQGNWDTAYTDRLKWDGGATGLTASTGRTSLGATTLGSNIFTITNPSAITFPRFNADNTVSALSATDFRTAIGAGTGSGTVTGVTATSPVASSGGTAPVISLASGYGDTQNPYGSKTANFVLAAPNGTAGAPTFRAIVAADIPTLNQNTTGTASNVTGTVAIANGGTGATTAATARTNLGATTVGSNMFTLTNPSAITFPRFNADNTVSALDAATFRTAIGAGTSSTTGTVTSVAATVPTGLSISGSPITSSGTLAITYTAGYSIPTTAKQTEWDSAYTQRLQWDGGSTNLVASTGRTSLGGTTVGQNFFTLTNPSAITFPRMNADNTVSSLSAADFRTAIGVGTGSGTVTSVAALTLGTTGTDLSSSVANGTTTPVITLNVPTASAANRGALSSSDWTTFNNKLTNPMSALGDSIYGGASGAATRLAGNTTTAKQFLSQTGTGSASAAPVWSALPTVLPVLNRSGSTVSVSVGNGVLPVLNRAGGTVNVAIN